MNARKSKKAKPVQLPRRNIELIQAKFFPTLRILAYVILGVVLALGVVLMIRDWRQVVPRILFTILASTTLASLSFIPCFLILLLQTRSFRAAIIGASKVWLEIFSQCTQQIC